MSKVYTMFHVPRVIDHYEYLPDKTPEIVHIPSNECKMMRAILGDVEDEQVKLDNKIIKTMAKELFVKKSA